MSILRLPVIILLRVFFYLDVSSLRKTAEVCQTFFKCTEMIAAANLDLSSEWRTLETVPVSSVTSFAFRVFEKLSLRYCVKVSYIVWISSEIQQINTCGPVWSKCSRLPPRCSLHKFTTRSYRPWVLQKINFYRTSRFSSHSSLLERNWSGLLWC